MVEGYRVVEGVEDVFLSRMQDVWDAETAVHGAVQIEDRVRIGTTLVPWNLGPLLSARALKRMDFASAWILLSRRGCRSIQDFWHALLGILRADIPPGGLELEGDPVAVCLKMANQCLSQGDYSPLLMTPTTEPYDRRGEWRRMTKEGFNDVGTFGLGPETSPPTFHSSFLLLNGHPTLKLTRIGKVSFVLPSPRHPDPLLNLATLFQAVLNFTGPSPLPFATTLSSRLYFTPPDSIPSLLTSPSRLSALQTLLTTQYNSPLDSPPSPSTTQTIASLLNLTLPDPTRPDTTPALTFLRLHGGTIHMGWFGGLIGVTCPFCLESSLYRAAFYKPPAEMRGCVAYRIEGLGYHFARREGVGVLVEGRRIVGRMSWATPACGCDVESLREMVSVEVPGFYGGLEGEWVAS